ncbi:MAG: ABC transporter substrate-binding protein, partial [candidate division WOR-3 bacterium]
MSSFLSFFLFSQAVQVTSGSALDYQPDMILAQDGRILVVYEVLNPGDLSGDLYSVYSTDYGSSWSSPAPIIITPSWSERHPALIEMPGGNFYLYYLSDSTGVYRIHLSVSTDFVNWTPRESVERLSKDPNVRVLQGPEASHLYTNFTVTRKPFDDVRVRKALIGYGLNRSAIAKSAMLGYATPSISFVSP